MQFKSRKALVALALIVLLHLSFATQHVFDEQHEELRALDHFGQSQNVMSSGLLFRGDDSFLDEEEDEGYTGDLDDAAADDDDEEEEEDTQVMEAPSAARGNQQSAQKLQAPIDHDNDASKSLNSNTVTNTEPNTSVTSSNVLSTPSSTTSTQQLVKEQAEMKTWVEILLTTKILELVFSVVFILPVALAILVSLCYCFYFKKFQVTQNLSISKGDYVKM